MAGLRLCVLASYHIHRYRAIATKTRAHAARSKANEEDVFGRKTRAREGRKRIRSDERGGRRSLSARKSSLSAGESVKGAHSQLSRRWWSPVVFCRGFNKASGVTSAQNDRRAEQGRLGVDLGIREQAGENRAGPLTNVPGKKGPAVVHAVVVFLFARHFQQVVNTIIRRNNAAKHSESARVRAMGLACALKGPP